MKTIEMTGRTYVPANPAWDTVMELLGEVPVVGACLGSVAGLGAVRVAATDFTGSGKASVITVHGPGGTPDVDILDGLSGQLLDRFFAYDPNFSGGLYLANTTR